MDAERRQELARWAEALERADGEEHRAAGRAIATLCETPDSLGPEERRDLARWAKRLDRSDAAELRAAGRAIRALLADAPSAGPASHDVAAEPRQGRVRGERRSDKPIATRSPARTRRPHRPRTPV